MTPQQIKDRRDELYRKREALKSIIRDLKEVKIEIASIAGEDHVKKHQEYLEATIININEEEKTLPVGHLYEGVYYKKRSDYYHIPREKWYEKKEGKLFMRIDLVSWKEPNDWTAYRHLYKDENQRTILPREEGRPVYNRDEVQEFH